MADLGLDDEVTAVENLDASALGFAASVLAFLRRFKSTDSGNPFGTAALKDAGVASGVAELDADTKLPFDQLPDNAVKSYARSNRNLESAFDSVNDSNWWSVEPVPGSIDLLLASYHVALNTISTSSFTNIGTFRKTTSNGNNQIIRNMQAYLKCVTTNTFHSEGDVFHISEVIGVRNNNFPTVEQTIPVQVVFNNGVVKAKRAPNICLAINLKTSASNYNVIEDILTPSRYEIWVDLYGAWLNPPPPEN